MFLPPPTGFLPLCSACHTQVDSLGIHCLLTCDTFRSAFIRRRISLNQNTQAAPRTAGYSTTLAPQLSGPTQEVGNADLLMQIFSSSGTKDCRIDSWRCLASQHHSICVDRQLKHAPEIRTTLPREISQVLWRASRAILESASLRTYSSSSHHLEFFSTAM